MMAPKIICIIILIIVDNFEAAEKSPVLAEAIAKLKLFASKLGQGGLKGGTAAATISSAASTGTDLINPSAQPRYKQCVLKCLFNRRRVTLPQSYVPVFEADFWKEPINCNLRLSWFAAAQFCRLKGLTLATFDSKSKITQLIYYVNSLVLSKRVAEFNDRRPFRIWTGGTNGNTNNFFWTDTGQPIDSDISSLLYNVTSKKSAYCIHAELTSNNTEKIQWKASSCNFVNTFVCEVPKLCYFQKCKTKTQLRTSNAGERFVLPCSPKPCPVCPKLSAYDKNNEKNGRFFNFNGVKYFLGEVLMSNEAAFAHCCKLQMSLWSMESPQEAEQMLDVLNSIGLNNMSAIHIHLNARDEKCDENFVWCTKEKRSVGAEYTWFKNEPDDFTGNEVCISLSADVDIGSRGLRDGNCGSRLFFVCKGNETTNVANSYRQYKFPPRVFQKMEVKEKLRCIKPNKEMKPDNTQGYVFSASGKTYFLSFDMKKNWDGFEHCCSMGMHMATIDTNEEFQAIVNFYSKNLTFKERLSHRILTISPFISKGDANFWFSTDKPVDINTIPMLFGEPDNFYSPENALSIFMYRSTNGLMDWNQMVPWHYLCQST
ncbi:uncharacterized protein LOC132203413 isoform X2 [Neocloeon triangulifer]|uniref:uncharacterized protein LOC132203413 isoform X2 n=1 Tax=Neocloeon triangulifer TaxID=2078957 RepID=UPI00286EBFD9|nr:uncharacterized protein LOC132203413 isoform X2 [Neocloeon triangulifer]